MYKYIAIVIAVFGLFGYHKHEVKTSYTKGQQNVQIAWDKDKAVQAALAEEARTDQEQHLKSIEVKYEKLLQEAVARNAITFADNTRLRNRLKQTASSGGSGALSPTADLSAYARRIQELTDLLDESIGLLEEGRERVERLDLKVKQLQELIKND